MAQLLFHRWKCWQLLCRWLFEQPTYYQVWDWCRLKNPHNSIRLDHIRQGANLRKNLCWWWCTRARKNDWATTELVMAASAVVDSLLMTFYCFRCPTRIVAAILCIYQTHARSHSSSSSLHRQIIVYCLRVLGTWMGQRQQKELGAAGTVRMSFTNCCRQLQQWPWKNRRVRRHPAMITSGSVIWCSSSSSYVFPYVDLLLLLLLLF